jgi:putative ABC transport system permease protein
MIGVMGLGIFSGFMHFSYWGIQENIIHVGIGTPEATGHFQIFNRKYLEKEEARYLDYGISGWKDLIAEVEQIPEVTFASPRIDIMGLVSNGEKTEPVVGFAIVPHKEKYLPGIFGSSEPYINLENAEDGIILGKELAKTMNAKKGEYLTLISSTVDGAINAVDLQFVGTINTGTPEGDKRLILVNLQTAMDLVQSDKVRKIVVVLQEIGSTDVKINKDELSPKMFFEADMEKAEEALVAILRRGDFALKTWKELNSYYDSVKGVYNTIFGFIGVVMAVVVILSIYNTMFMAVVERTREIGTLMAVGTPRQYILLLFLLEGLIIAFVGASLGYGSTYVMAQIISDAGLSMPPPPGGTEGYPLIIHEVYSWWFYIALFIMFNTVVACFLPAYRASKMDIVKALYHV